MSLLERQVEELIMNLQNIGFYSHKHRNYNLKKKPNDRKLYIKTKNVRSVLGTKYGFCDKCGNLIIPCIYDKVEEFEE